MQSYTKCSVKEFNKIIKKHGREFVFLHHTGNMLGMGCPVSDKKAIAKINSLKQRGSGKSMITLLPDLDWLDFYSKQHNTISGEEYVPIKVELSARTLFLLEQFWPGNLTVILPTHSSFEYDHLTIDNCIALRVPTSSCLRSFIRALGVPVTSTSINVSGEQPVERLSEIDHVDWFDFALLPTEEVNKPTNNSTIIKIEEDTPVLLRAGSIPFDEIEETNIHPSVLFVCTGNICRSPMAEYYARKVFTDSGLPYRTESSGMMAGGFSISNHSYEMLKTDDIDAKTHLSKSTDYKLLQRTWLVLTMEDSHKKMLCDRFPLFRHKIYTLAEFSGFEGDVDDPYMGDIGLYENTYQKIKRYTDIIVKKLRIRTKEAIPLQALKELSPEI